MPTLWRVLKDEFKKHPAFVTGFVLLFGLWLVAFILFSFLFAFPILIGDKRDEWTEWWMRGLKKVRKLW